MSGALLERVRLSAYLVLAVLLGSVVWILDAAWGWSAGGWLTLRFGFHDSIASGVVHGVAGAFTLGVLFNLGPRIGKYTKEGLARGFRPHNLHMTALGLMLIFTGFYAFYGACLVIASTSFPGWANIYLSPATLGSITMVITMGFAGGFTGGYFASRGDPFWTISGGLAGVIGVSAGADVYAPTLAYLLSALTAVLVVYAGGWIETKMRVDDAVGAVAVHGVAGFLGHVLGRRLRRGLPDGPQQRGVVDGRPARWAWRRSCRSASSPAGSRRSCSRRRNLLRVPPEVEIEGLDMVEYGELVYPEFDVSKEFVVEPDGTLVETATVAEVADDETATATSSRGAAGDRVPDLAAHHGRRRRRDPSAGPCARSAGAT